MATPHVPRMTIPTQYVLTTLLAEPDRECYGAEIGLAAGLASGTIHPILGRLEGVGWLTSRWEQIDASAAGRPARRYYRLTADGVSNAQAALAGAYRTRSPFASLRPATQS